MMTTQRKRLTENQGRARACTFLQRLIGETPTDLYWDEDHHRQGHVHVGTRELVVIAPCDTIHPPIVLTVEDWYEIQDQPGEHAGALVRKRAIHDHDRLLALCG